jgi:hypothetical protein
MRLELPDAFMPPNGAFAFEPILPELFQPDSSLS